LQRLIFRAVNNVCSWSTGVDGMISVLGHEIAEVITDPYLDGWFDVNGDEIGGM